MEPFDPTDAADRAAAIVDRELCGPNEEDMGPLNDLHTLCFNALGTTNDEIATTLLRYECLGRPADKVTDDGETYGDLVDRRDNPLAIYLVKVCGAANAELGTDGGIIYWDGTEPGSEIGHEDVQLPPQLVAFQRAYENFEHPELHRAGAKPQNPDQIIDRTPVSDEQAERDLDAAIARNHAERAARPVVVSLPGE